MAPPTLIGSEVMCECGTMFTHTGRGSRCSECYNRLQRERRAADPERARAYHREWSAKNQDKVKAKRDKYMSDPRNLEASRARSREYYAKNQDRLRAAALEKAPLAKIMSYGITGEQFDEMMLRQHGVCAICEQDNARFFKRLAIDHDHETGAVRGLLCNSCNGALGLFKDDPDLLLKALDYLLEKD